MVRRISYLFNKFFGKPPDQSEMRLVNGSLTDTKASLSGSDKRKHPDLTKTEEIVQSWHLKKTLSLGKTQIKSPTPGQGKACKSLGCPGVGGGGEMVTSQCDTCITCP